MDPLMNLFSGTAPSLGCHSPPSAPDHPGDISRLVKHVLDSTTEVSCYALRVTGGSPNSGEIFACRHYYGFAYQSKSKLRFRAIEASC